MKLLTIAFACGLSIPALAQGRLYRIPMQVGPYAIAQSGTPKLPPCVSGSCTATWSGPSGQTVPAYNASLKDFSGSLPAANYLLTGTGSIALNGGFAQGGFVFSSSTSSTIQAVILAAPTAAYTLAKSVSIRVTPGIDSGYSLVLKYSDGGTGWNRACIEKGNTELACGGSTTYTINANHTLLLVGVGTSSTALTGTVDGSVAVTFTDTSSPDISGNPGVFGATDVSTANSLFGTIQDHP